MSKFVVMATWDDVPHLAKKDKDELWSSIPPFQREARSKGIPQLGSGAIYPISEDEIVCKPFDIPDYWPRAFGLDVGWNRTAAVWAAVDQESDTAYLYSEYYRGAAEPAVHMQAIKSRGDWIPGVVDPSARGRSTADGVRLIELYGDLYLDYADNSVDSGLLNVWGRLSSGRLKIFDNLQNWRNEFRIYRRDEKGKIVKLNDHLMDATRYLVVSGLYLARTKPTFRDTDDATFKDTSRSGTTGY